MKNCKCCCLSGDLTMYSRECATCEHVLDCKGKPSEKPCLCYKDRRKGGMNERELKESESNREEE